MDALVTTNDRAIEDPHESDDEDGYYENPVEVIREFGNNPLMQRAQQALLKQLKESNYRLKTDLIAKIEDKKRVSQEREILGVQLYGLQQQLARIQVTLETAHNEYNGIVDSRLKEEDMLREVSKNNDEQVVQSLLMIVEVIMKSIAS